MSTATVRGNRGIKSWSKLRTRMAVSYVTVSLVIVLGLLSAFSALVIYTLTRTPVLAHLVAVLADRTAQTYALQAAVWAQGDQIHPETTFEPGHATSLGSYEDEYHTELSPFTMEVPYVEPGTPPPEWLVVGLLVGAEGQVISSSYPDQYPVSLDIDQAFSEDAALIRSALVGKTDYAIRDDALVRSVSLARPVWSDDREPIGAVYVQVPAGGAQNIPLFPQVATIVIPSGLLLLCLMLPVGAFFGALTTRGLVRRVEQLASATSRFADGDFAQRVAVRKPDEIGQLELQFNQMAGQLVDSIAQRQALAAESARREERARQDQEMSSAYYIQKSLLPKENPEFPGWEIEPFYRPAQQVGGDLYDFLALPNGKLGLVVGDANGKGMPSALIMATTCAMLRAAAPGEASPGRVLSRVNELLHIYIPPMNFTTCFYGILDPISGQFRYANAGHNLPYLRQNGQVAELRAAGMPLGLMPEQEYLENEVHVRVGDTLLFYSDGVVEAHNGNKEMYGSQRIIDLIERHSNTGKLLDALLVDLEGFTGTGWEQEDDITLVQVKRTS